MRRFKLLLLALVAMSSLSLSAQNVYTAAFIGAKSDGTTNNTGSIQAGIDSLSSKGGGTIEFYVGRYVIGTIYLKDNVTIDLKEGAVLVGTKSPYDYQYVDGNSALIIADGIKNASIIGKGVIEGTATELISNFDKQEEAGNLAKGCEDRPSLILINNSKEIKVGTDLLNLRSSAGESVIKVVNSDNVLIDGASIHSNENPSTSGVVVEGGNAITMSNTFVDVPATSLKVKDSKVVVTNSKSANGKSVKASK